MEQKDYEQIKNGFFASYKSFVDFVMLTHDGYNMYSILILKKPTYNGMSKVSIIIRNSYFGEDTSNEFSSSVLLSANEANNLINDIRNDFRDNHFILYSGVNPRTLIQTLQNTRFSLNIKLNNEQEYKEAIIFNDKINRNGKRYKVLNKN